MFAECAHGDVDEFAVPVLLDDGNHLLDDVLLGLKLEGLVAVGIVEDHLVDLYGNARRPLHDFLLFLPLAQLSRKQDAVFPHHRVLVPEIASEQNGAHVSSEEDHGSAGDVLCVEERELDNQLLFDDGQLVGLVVVVGEDVLYLGVLAEDVLFGLVGAVNVAVVPERRKPLVVIAVEVREEVVEGVLREGLAEVEVVDDDVGVGDKASH